jgi:alpha-ketoglutarate-dependent taurine dioxygenase
MITNNLFYAHRVDVEKQGFEKDLKAALSSNGLVTFEKALTKKELVEFSKYMGDIYFHRDSDGDGVTSISAVEENEGKEGYLGLSSSELTLHTDRSGVKNPPGLLVFYCEKNADEGGDSLLLDGKKLYEELEKYHPKVVNILSEPGTTIFGGSEPILGSIFTKLTNGNISIRFRHDNIIFHSKKAWQVLPTLITYLERLQITFRLKENQGYIIKNDQWLHGRTSFKGVRQMYRILLDPFEKEKIGQLAPGFKPTSNINTIAL